MCFVVFNRPQLRADHPDLAPKELLKLAGQKWNTLSASEKQKWTDESIVANKRRFEDEEAENGGNPVPR